MEALLPDVQEFFDRLMRELEKERKRNPQEFALRLSNDAAPRRHIRGSSRTDLMLGIPEDRFRVLPADDRPRAGVVPRALNTFTKSDGRTFELSYDRVNDIVLYEGDWRSGKRVNEGVIEVENRIDEFKATVSDLLRTQGRWKIAVFYEDSPDLQGREAEIRNVFEHFKNSRFTESPGTQYLVVFGPPAIRDDIGIGVWHATRFEASLPPPTPFTHLRYPPG